MFIFMRDRLILQPIPQKHNLNNSIISCRTAQPKNYNQYFYVRGIQMIGKVVLIIGGSDGIGLATAKLFAAKGATVYNGSRTECPIAAVKNLTVDVTHPHTIQRGISRLFAEQRRLDYVIYCAGISIASPADNTVRSDYRYLYEVNLFGAIETVRFAVPPLEDSGGGRIVLISSLASVVPVPFEAFYSSSKAALNSLAMELNLELNPRNIYVTSLLPGGVATDFSYKRKIYTGSIDDSTTLSDELSAAETIFDIEQSGNTPQSIAAAILKTIQKPTPDIIKTVGLKNKLSAVTYKLLPDKLALKVLARRFGTTPPPNPSGNSISDS